MKLKTSKKDIFKGYVCIYIYRQKALSPKGKSYENKGPTLKTHSPISYISLLLVSPTPIHPSKMDPSPSKPAQSHSPSHF